jgi:outer membrane protein OmpU
MNKTKGENMINLKKVGLTALAGSLVAVSATAGEMSVTGSANVTYVTGKSAGGANGKSIGTDKDVAFTGSGELDNGWTFTVSTLLTDAYSVSSSYTSLTMGSLGTVSFGADTGGANYKYDEEVPQAYEQMSDAQQTTANRIGTTHDSNMIVYNSPSFDLGGATASFDLEYSPNAGSSSAPANDGGSATANDNYGSGVGAGVTLAYDALKVGVYAAELERNQTNATSCT